MNYLQELGLFPDDGSFCHTSISYQDHQIFAQDLDNANRVRQEELPGFDNFTFSSNDHPLEDNLTSNIDKNSVGCMTDIESEDDNGNIDENSVENMTTIEFKDNQSCINEEDFNSLSPQAKDVWCVLPNDMKTALIKSRNSSQGSDSDNNNYSNHSNPIYNPVKPPSYARIIPPSSARNIPPLSEHIHEDIPPSSEFQIIPLASPASAQKDASLSDKPTNSEIASHSIESETSPANATPTPECATHHFDHATPTFDCATPTPERVPPTSECATLASLNNEADIDQSFERSIVSSDVVERSLGHHHQDYDHSPDLPNRNDKFLPQETSFASEGITSYLSSFHEIEFEFDSSPFFPMETILPQEEVKILKSPSSSSLETSSRKNSSLQKILKLIRIAPSFKDHKSILSLIVRSSSFKNPIPHSSCEDIMKLKTFLLQNMHSSSILREALHRLKEIEPRILPSPHSSTEETSPSIKDFKKPVAPHPIEYETSPAQRNLRDFITPAKGKKVSFNEDSATRIMTPSPRIITPPSSQPASTYRKKKKNQLAIVTSTLIASSLTSNVESHSVLRPKRRTSKARPTQEVFPPLKKSPSSSLEMCPSSLSSDQVSAFTSDFKFYLDSCEFPSSAFTTSDENKRKKIEDMKKKTHDLKKRISIIGEKSYDVKVENIFGKKKGSKSFIKTLNSLNSFHPHASHPTLYSVLCNENSMFNISSEHSCSKFKCSPEHCGNIRKINESIFEHASSDATFHASSKCSSRSINHVSKFQHLRYSRFSSTRKVFQHHFYLKHPSFDHHSFSKDSIRHVEGMPKFHSSTKSLPIVKDNLISKYPPTTEEGTSTSAHHPPSYSSKKILGPTKTLDLSELEKTSGTYNTFRSSHLGTSTSNKSKDAKHNKSSHKIKSSGTSSPACCSRSTSRSRCSTLSRLVNGEQTLYFIAFFISIILMLLYFFILKLLHLPFNRGKDSSIILTH